MLEKIIIAVVSSIIGGILFFIGSNALGLFEIVVSETQAHRIAELVVNKDEYSEVLINKLKKIEELRGPTGPKGESGATGPQGVQGPGVKMLVMAIIKNKQVVYSTAGLTYDASTGIIKFPNPDNKNYVPLVSDYGDNYITGTHYITTLDKSHNQFRILHTALDSPNQDRTWPANSFCVIVLAEN